MKKHFLMLASWSILAFGAATFSSCDDDDEVELKKENTDNGNQNNNQNGGDNQNQNGGDNQGQNGGDNQGQNGGDNQGQNGGDNQGQNGGDNQGQNGNEDQNQNGNDDQNQNGNNEPSAADIYNQYSSQSGAQIVGDDVVYTATAQGETTVIIMDFDGDDIVGGKAYMDLKTVDTAKAAYAEALAEGSNVELDGTILIYTMTDSDVQAFDGVPKDQLVMLMTLAGGNLGGGISDIMDNLGNLGNLGGLGDLGNLFGGK